MKKIEITLFELASRFIGMEEVPGIVDNPQIMAMLQLDDKWPQHDEVPWCSGFLNYVCWLLKLPRSKSLAAISWETIGQEIKLEEAEVGFDIIVYEHHVGIYGGRNNGRIALLGGNQDNKVSIANFPEESVVTVRRLYA